MYPDWARNPFRYFYADRLPSKDMVMVPITEAAKESCAQFFDESLNAWDREFLRGVKVKL